MLPRQERFLYLAVASLVALVHFVEAKNKDSSQDPKNPQRGGSGEIPDICYNSECIYATWFEYCVS